MEDHAEKLEHILAQKDDVIDGLHCQLDYALGSRDKEGRQNAKVKQDGARPDRSKSSEETYKERFMQLYQKYKSVLKSIKSYDSAIDRLTVKIEDQRHDR